MQALTFSISVHTLLKIAIVVNISFIKIHSFFHLHASLPSFPTSILISFSLPKLQPIKVVIEQPEDDRAHEHTKT